MKKEELIESFYYLLMFLTLGVMILNFTSCSKAECIDYDYSERSLNQYKAVGYNLAIEVISRGETTINARIIWNELREDEIDCEIVTLDARILEGYKVCPWCPNLCDN